MIMTNIKRFRDWCSSLFITPEELYLSRSVDLADFERRQRIVERDRYRNLFTHMYY